jgi:hypothetical protein
MKKAYTPSTEALGPPSPEVQHKATLGHKEPDEPPAVILEESQKYYLQQF